jgi:hypothetical protein
MVFGSKFERDGVRPRGNLVSAATFKALPCTPEPASVGQELFYRCGDAWFQRIEHEGWTCYSEIWPPAGAHVSSLPPGHLVFHSGGRTLYAGTDAWYERQEGGYVVIEPPVGLAVDNLPDSARDGIPVVVNGVSYYRHLGIFYREEEPEDGFGSRRYVVAKSPFELEQPTSVQMVQSGIPGSTEGGPLEAGGATQPYVPAEPFAPMPSTGSSVLAPPAATPGPYGAPFVIPSR